MAASLGRGRRQPPGRLPRSTRSPGLPLQGKAGPGNIPTVDLRRELRLALELADLADAVTVPRFGAEDLAVATKPDRTPVSEADRAAEEAMRRRLAQDRPDHGVLGEELGEAPAARARWVLDPIDGTINYLRRIPVWATLIALQVDGAGVVGVVSAPLLGRRWWAARGLGAWCNAEPIRVSGVARLGNAQLSITSQVTFEECGFGAQGLALSRRCWRTRGFGDFWSHLLVAEGAADVAVDPVAAIWDLAAPQVIVEEAGGSFTDFSGRACPDGGNGVSSNGLLHGEVLALLSNPAPQVPPRRGLVVP